VFCPCDITYLYLFADYLTMPAFQHVPDQQSMDEGNSSTSTPLLGNGASTPTSGCTTRAVQLIALITISTGFAIFWHLAAPSKSQSTLVALPINPGQAQTWNWSVGDLTGGVNLTSIPGVGRHWYLEPSGVDKGLCSRLDWQWYSPFALAAPKELRGAFLVPFAMVMSIFFKLMQSSLQDKIFKCIGCRWDLLTQKRQSKLLKSDGLCKIESHMDLESCDVPEGGEGSTKTSALQKALIGSGEELLVRM